MEIRLGIYSVKNKLLLLAIFFISIINYNYGQEDRVIISGKVMIKDTQEPLPGVNIVEKGTDNGTATDFDGKYEIKVEKGHELSFSSIGFQTETRIVVNENIINVEMKEGNKLDEVVIGYSTIKTRDLTSAVSSANMKNIQAQPSSNIGDALQGKVSGVRVITSGKPGDNPTLRIRGTGTIGDNDPLIVVDGMPLNGGLNQVNMRDVESLQVLKDASAAAIYGSRGANGVVEITTKKGKKGKGKINVEAFTGFQKSTNRIKVLNAAEFAKLNNEVLKNGGKDPNPKFKDPSSLGEGTDWMDALFTTGHQKSVSVSYSKGDENTSIYTSLNAFDQKGIIINNDYQRYNFQVNSRVNLNDNLRFGNDLKINYDVKKNGENNITDAIFSLPTQPIFNNNGGYSGPEGSVLYSGDIENPIGKRL